MKNNFVWDLYEPGEIGGMIKYWVDLWEDLIENFCEKLYGLDLINPQLLIMEIIDEIEFNQLQNFDNKEYFYKQLKRLVNRDPVLKDRFKADFTLIKKDFNNNRNAYILQLCKSVLEIFQNGEYFDELFNLLEAILLDPNCSDSQQEDIEIITQHLIVELILKGYSLETIKSFPRRLFDKYRFVNGDINTEYPFNTKRSDFEEGNDFDKSKFYCAIKKEIDELSITDRISRFRMYYRKKPNKYYFIFQIDGLKGDVDFNIGKVNFYSPKVKKYITEALRQNDEPEYFGLDR